MTRWAAFAGVTLAVLVLLLLLARASQALVTDTVQDPDRNAGVGPDAGRHAGRRAGVPDPGWLDALPDGADHLDAAGSPTPAGSLPEPAPGPAASEPIDEHRNLSTPMLLANVAASHGVFALVLLGGVWLTGVPASALGVTADPLSTGPLAVAVGLGLGVALAIANTLAAGLAKAFGADPSEELRSLLAPENLAGWAVLLLVVLPVIAGFEELLFRGALIGAFAVGFDISPWLLVVLSSAAFAVGHGAQGGLGVVVTGLLGLALAVGFVLTGSLVVVVVAHYVVNAVEFVVAEGIGWEPF